MGIRGQCEQCGRHYDVSDELAGQSFSCSACGERIKLPADDESLDVLDEVEELDEDQDEDALDELEEVPAPSAPQLFANSRLNLPAATPPRAVQVNTFEHEPESVWGPRIFLTVLAVVVLGFIGLGATGIVLLARAMTPTPQVIPQELPEPPFAVPPPPAPQGSILGLDLNEVDGEELSGIALAFAAQGNYHNAVLCQHAAVSKSGTGQYNLACFYSRTGAVNAAYYWLQEAARGDGVDATWAADDLDLTAVRADDRWPTMQAFLQQCSLYWEHSGYSESVLILPDGATPDKPLPVLVGLHGMGHSAHGFIVPEWYQKLANEHQIAVIGVSGTQARGKNSFVWSEDPVADLARVDAALQEFSSRLKIQEGQTILFGFSQGGKMSAELAARHPERFAGAIILSAGGRSGQDVSGITPLPAHQRQGYVVACGGGEGPGNVALAREYDSELRRLSPRVILKIDPNQDTHTLPENFLQRLPEWIRFIQNPGTPTAGL